MRPKKLGRYDLIRVLGKGAMGLVYEGRDPNLDRRVAIKTIKVENLSDEAEAEYEVRFRTEARSAARLQHPNIVSVYDSDRDLDIAYLVMEFVQGDDLKHHLDRGDVYTLEQTLGIMTELLSALEYAHQQKIVHRDIKPANLLVQVSGSVKLADFGVARIQDSGDATRTQGTIVGTLKYMSPEQIQGRPIDARADLFAAAVVLYQLLTNRRPFDGDNDFAVIQKIVNHTPESVTSYNPKLPPALDVVVAKALAKSRDMRYASALEFSQALDAACGQASDITVVPAAVLPAKGGNMTWTATMMRGESLVATNTDVVSGSATGSGASSGTSSSLVTQEVELVYWKDIKESNDVQDLQGFLAKFPDGIYAGLAHRRLKTLGVVMRADPTVTLVSPHPSIAVPLPSTTDFDKTLPLSKQVSFDTDSSDALIKPNADPTQATRKPDASADPAAPDKSRKSAVWLIAGAAALVVVGAAFKLLSGSGATPDMTSAVVSNVSAQLTTAAPDAKPPSALAATSPGLTVDSATKARSVAEAAPPASKAVSLAELTAEPAHDKHGKVDGVKAVEPGLQTSKTATVARSTAPRTSANPRDACEDRVLFAFQNCVSEQCAKPVFTRHPICIERRAMDERRREAARNR
jgi:serine/threonine protein kinase